MKSAGKARNNGLYRHIRTSKEIIRNLLNDYWNTINTNISFYSHPLPMIGSLCVPLSYFSKNKYTIGM